MERVPMTLLEEALRKKKRIRVLGIDDAPFKKRENEIVNIVGVVCSQTRFEGMLWNAVRRDGSEATEVLIEMVKESKFFEQLHLIIIDGIAVGGFNIIDISAMNRALSLPCLTIMRRHPNLESVDIALQRFDDYEKRKTMIENAGPIHESREFVYQVVGCEPETASLALVELTDTGKVPEALRLAHLIASAVKNGESSKRA